MKTLVIVSFSLIISLSFAQTKVGGVSLPDTEFFGEYQLTLNGAGVRKKLWVDIYAAGLYVNKRSDNAEALINSDQPMAVKLHIVSKLINSEKMIAAVEEGFENSTNGNTVPLQEKINLFIASFEGEIEKGDIFDITYQPEKGVVSYKNGKEKGIIKGEEFKKALFGIWLSNRPTDDDLKIAMLGGN